MLHLYEGSKVRMHYWWDGKEKKAQYLVRFEHRTSESWGVCSAAVLQPRPDNLELEKQVPIEQDLSFFTSSHLFRFQWRGLGEGDQPRRWAGQRVEKVGREAEDAAKRQEIVGVEKVDDDDDDVGQQRQDRRQQPGSGKSSVRGFQHHHHRRRENVETTQNSR